MTVFVGTSGWQYRHWRGLFYPRGVPQREWLAYYADRFAVVEVNNTFYGLPKEQTFAGWAAATPPDFVFALKVSRFLTHVRRLRDPQDPVDRFLKAASPLGQRLGPVLLQLPPNFPSDAPLLDAALRAFPKRVRVALEPRDDSWFSDEVKALLSERNVALCLADRDASLVTPVWRTADWGYVRLHAGTGSPPSGYAQRDLEEWADRIGSLWSPESDVYVFFNNDAHGCAIRDAGVLVPALKRVGLRPSRVA